MKTLLFFDHSQSVFRSHRHRRRYRLPRIYRELRLPLSTPFNSHAANDIEDDHRATSSYRL
jgi:hypothetical protein